jgi:hypothetical protein
MDAGRRVSGWARAALGFGIGSLVLAALTAIPARLGGEPWWEANDAAQAEAALSAGTARAVALVAAATAVSLAGALIGLAGIRQYLVSQVTAPGTVVGLGRAFAGMLLSGFSGSVLVYAALKELGHPDRWHFLAVPAGANTLLAARACWWWRHRGRAALAALTPAEQSTAADAGR